MTNAGRAARGGSGAADESTRGEVLSDIRVYTDIEFDLSVKWAIDFVHGAQYIDRREQAPPKSQFDSRRSCPTRANAAAGHRGGHVGTVAPTRGGKE